MAGMFNRCNVLTNLDVSNFKTTNVTDMSYMFYTCGSLTQLDLSSFNTRKVTDKKIRVNNSNMHLVLFYKINLSKILLL